MNVAKALEIIQGLADAHEMLYRAVGGSKHSDIEIVSLPFGIIRRVTDTISKAQTAIEEMNI